MKTTTFKVWQGNSDGGELKTYEVEVDQGYVVLDAIHRIPVSYTHLTLPTKA